MQGPQIDIQYCQSSSSGTSDRSDDVGRSFSGRGVKTQKEVLLFAKQSKMGGQVMFDCALYNDCKGKQFGLMVKHLNKTHFMVRPFQCADCNVGFHNSALLAGHRHTTKHLSNTKYQHENVFDSVYYSRNEPYSVEACAIEKQVSKDDMIAPLKRGSKLLINVNLKLILMSWKRRNMTLYLTGCVLQGYLKLAVISTSNS
ncbi:hypothetical protein [Endozoicomonas elysicola]|nr:hypothetical protein [Endozoicomonas elysicola]